MAQLKSLDPSTPMFAQFTEKTGPIVLANTFLVPQERAEAFLPLFRRQAEFMKAQPGFVSLRMHKGTAGSRLLMNVAVWESTEALAAAQSDKIRLDSNVRSKVRGVMTAEQVQRFHQLQRQMRRDMREEQQRQQDKETGPEGKSDDFRQVDNDLVVFLLSIFDTNSYQR